MLSVGSWPWGISMSLLVSPVVELAAGVGVEPKSAIVVVRGSCWLWWCSFARCYAAVLGREEYVCMYVYARVRRVKQSSGDPVRQEVIKCRLTKYSQRVL